MSTEWQEANMKTSTALGKVGLLFVDISGVFNKLWLALFLWLRDLVRLGLSTEAFETTAGIATPRRQDKSGRKDLRKADQGLLPVCSPVFWDIVVEELLTLSDEEENIYSFCRWHNDTNIREFKTYHNNIVIRVVTTSCNLVKLWIFASYALMKENLQRHLVEVKNGPLFQSDVWWETKFSRTTFVMQRFATLSQRQFKILVVCIRL